jgi:hypothetical protein
MNVASAANGFAPANLLPVVPFVDALGYHPLSALQQASGGASCSSAQKAAAG